MEKRPDFETLVSYEEFKKYYWYRKELSGICRKLGIEYKGTELVFLSCTCADAWRYRI